MYVCAIQYMHVVSKLYTFFYFFEKRTLDDEDGGMGWLGEGEGWGWGMGDGRWGVVVLDVVARCVQHTK